MRAIATLPGWAPSPGARRAYTVHERLQRVRFSPPHRAHRLCHVAAHLACPITCESLHYYMSTLMRNSHTPPVPVEIFYAAIPGRHVVPDRPLFELLRPTLANGLLPPTPEELAALQEEAKQEGKELNLPNITVCR